MAKRSSTTGYHLDGATSRRRILQAGIGGASLAAVGAVSAGHAAEPEFEFRLQSFLGPGWMEWEELLPRYIERVKQASNGRIAITPFPPGQLVPTFDLLEAVGNGVVDMGFGAQVYWRGTFPFTEWTWGIPFAFRSLDNFDYLWWEAGLTDLVREAFATRNVYFLGPIYSDEWGATMSREPIQSLKDFEGLKIRSFGIGAAIWERHGASITRLPGEELYTGLSTGVIDGVNWGSPYGMVATKLHEVAKYYTGPSLISYDMEDMFINMDAWNQLPEDLQQAMVLATRVFAVERAATSTTASAQAIQTMRDAGVTIARLPDEDIETMRAMTPELLNELAGDDEYTKRALDIILSTKETLDQRPQDI